MVSDVLWSTGVYRHILKTPWIARVTKEEVLRRIGHGRKLMTIIKAYLCHIVPNHKLSPTSNHAGKNRKKA